MDHFGLQKHRTVDESVRLLTSATVCLKSTSTETLLKTNLQNIREKKDNTNSILEALLCVYMCVCV